MDIAYKTGDATRPDESPAIIVHVCNNVGAWGAGFVLALSKLDKNPERAYRSWALNGVDETGYRFELGSTQFCSFGNAGDVVANMIAQNNTSRRNGPPIDYDALDICLETVAQTAASLNKPVVGPKFGAGIAGGDWTIIEGLIQKHLINNFIPVTIYTLG
jgi:O-acetyl-ADP-ribose deacetylase (regulator of RNase III)